MKKSLFFAAAVLLLAGCSVENPKDDHLNRNGDFLNEVVALTDFNSEFDDYNSNLPSNKYGQTHLVFSSKRNKKEFLFLVYFPA